MRSATNVAAISLSKPIFINAFLGLLSRINNVTSSQPKFENILAYSIATIPLPVITTDLGRKFKPLIESESNTRTPSNGIPTGRKGLDPVASNILSAEIVVVVFSILPSYHILSFDITNWCDPPESLNFAYPSTKVTPAYSSCLLMSCALKEASSAHELIISFHTLSSRNPIPRRVETLIRFAVSLMALENRPVGPPIDKSSLVSSFINFPEARGASIKTTFIFF
mmetsp:Transcript_15175/g.17045  ORF Transcript_15175/g.17045 Transcript_15175/m.17045 type:complete len:225 (+) Transcript_15175:1090-1764(+)